MQHVVIMTLDTVLSKIENYYLTGAPQILTMSKETMDIAEKFLPTFHLVFDKKTELEDNGCVVAILIRDDKGGAHSGGPNYNHHFYQLHTFHPNYGWGHPYPYGMIPHPFGGQGAGRLPGAVASTADNRPRVDGDPVYGNGGVGGGGAGASY